MPYYTDAPPTPQDSIGYLLRRANGLSMALAEAAFQDTEISFIQWVVLALVNSGTADTCAGISRNLGYNSGAMTRLVDQLEQRGLLCRQRDSRDRRITRLALTGAGKAVVVDLGKRIYALWNDLLDGLDPADIRRVIAVLNTLVNRLETASQAKVGA